MQAIMRSPRATPPGGVERRELRSLHEHISDWGSALEALEENEAPPANDIHQSINSLSQRWRPLSTSYQEQDMSSVHEDIRTCSQKYRPLSVSYQQWEQRSSIHIVANKIPRDVEITLSPQKDQDDPFSAKLDEILESEEEFSCSEVFSPVKKQSFLHESPTKIETIPEDQDISAESIDSDAVGEVPVPLNRKLRFDESDSFVEKEDDSSSTTSSEQLEIEGETTYDLQTGDVMLEVTSENGENASGDAPLALKVEQSERNFESKTIHPTLNDNDEFQNVNVKNISTLEVEELTAQIEYEEDHKSADGSVKASKDGDNKDQTNESNFPRQEASFENPSYAVVELSSKSTNMAFSDTSDGLTEGLEDNSELGNEQSEDVTENKNINKTESSIDLNTKTLTEEMSETMELLEESFKDKTEQVTFSKIVETSSSSFVEKETSRFEVKRNYKSETNTLQQVKQVVPPAVLVQEDTQNQQNSPERPQMGISKQSSSIVTSIIHEELITKVLETTSSSFGEEVLPLEENIPGQRPLSEDCSSVSSSGSFPLPPPMLLLKQPDSLEEIGTKELNSEEHVPDHHVSFTTPDYFSTVAALSSLDHSISSPSHCTTPPSHSPTPPSHSPTPPSNPITPTNDSATTPNNPTTPKNISPTASSNPLTPTNHYSTAPSHYPTSPSRSPTPPSHSPTSPSNLLTPTNRSPTPPAPPPTPARIGFAKVPKFEIEKAVMDDVIHIEIPEHSTIKDEQNNIIINQPVEEDKDSTTTNQLVDQPVVVDKNKTTTDQLVDQPVVVDKNKTTTDQLVDQPVEVNRNKTTTDQLVDQPAVDDKNKTTTDQLVVEDSNQTITDQSTIEEVTLGKDVLLLEVLSEEKACLVGRLAKESDPEKLVATEKHPSTENQSPDAIKDIHVGSHVETSDSVLNVKDRQKLLKSSVADTSARKYSADVVTSLNSSSVHVSFIKPVTDNNDRPTNGADAFKAEMQVTKQEPKIEAAAESDTSGNEVQMAHSLNPFKSMVLKPDENDDKVQTVEKTISVKTFVASAKFSSPPKPLSTDNKTKAPILNVTMKETPKFKSIFSSFSSTKKPKLDPDSDDDQPKLTSHNKFLFDQKRSMFEMHTEETPQKISKPKFKPGKLKIVQTAGSIEVKPTGNVALKKQVSFQATEEKKIVLSEQTSSQSGPADVPVGISKTADTTPHLLQPGHKQDLKLYCAKPFSAPEDSPLTRSISPPLPKVSEKPVVSPKPLAGSPEKIEFPKILPKPQLHSPEKMEPPKISPKPLVRPTEKVKPKIFPKTQGSKEKIPPIQICPKPKLGPPEKMPSPETPPKPTLGPPEKMPSSDTPPKRTLGPPEKMSSPEIPPKPTLGPPEKMSSPEIPPLPDFSLLQDDEGILLEDKPSDKDFILPPLPPPPSDEFLLKQQKTSENKDSQFGISYKASHKATAVWQPTSPTSPNNTEFPPPPDDLPSPPNHPADPTTISSAKPFGTTEKSKGFRSVSHPVAKKPTKGPETKVENSTKVSIHGTPFPAPPGAEVEVTPTYQLPDGAVYQTTTKEGEVYHTDTYYPAANPGDPQSVVLERTKTTTLVKAPHHQGMGPTTGTGVPTALRTSVDDSKHWYKNMFKQMHKVDGVEDGVDTNGTTRPMSADSDTRHVSMETDRPIRVGKITDYQPAVPYVVENKPKIETSTPTPSNSYSQQTKMTSNHGNKQPTSHQFITGQMRSEPVKRVSQQRKSQGDGVRQPAKAKFDFHGRSAKELSLKRGQTVVVVRRVDDNWYMAESPDGVRSGIIPVQYLKLMTTDQPDKPTRHGQAKAKFDFNGKTKNELSFKKGDDIILLKRVDDNWYRGKLGSSTGILPVAYVEVQLEPEVQKVKKEVIPKELEVSPRNSHHSQQSSVLSQASTTSSEPDENERKNRAAFLAHSVVDHTPALVSNHHNHKRELELTDLDNVINQITTTTPPPEVHYDYPKPTKTSPPKQKELTPQNLPQMPSNPPHSTLPLPSVPSYPSSSIGSQPSTPRAPTPTLEAEQIVGRYVALYAYDSCNEDELDLSPGDVIQVVEICDDGWYVGSSEKTGAFGTFPGNYVTPTH